MDSVLSNLFPIHQVGADGFNWWIGQIESEKNEDLKKSGRYRVRIIGEHLKTCDVTPSEQLPWANVMMPVTTPFTDGGVTGATVDLRLGNWVVGFYLDSDKTKPIIMGSIGHTAGATKVSNVEKDPNPGGTCKSFTTYLSPNINPYTDLPAKQSTETDRSTTVGEAGQIANAVPGKESSMFYALFNDNTSTNTTGSRFCVEIANPKCGSEANFETNLKNIVADMFKANQQSGGAVGSYYVSQATGQLNSYINEGRKYTTKASRLVRSSLARVKGEIIKFVEEGIKKLIDLALVATIPATDKLGNTNTGPVNPDLGIKPFTPITQRQSRLKPIIDLLNEILDDIGCKMEDLTDKIIKWLTDYLMKIFMEAFQAATCLIDTIVESILSEILGAIEELISDVLAPILDVLGTVADAANIVGGAINEVFSLLGIVCSGPNATCSKTTKECYDCSGDDDDQDWLDKLIDTIENGPLATTSVCEEATEAVSELTTTVIPIGGVLLPSSSFSITDINYICNDITVVEGSKATFSIQRSGDIRSSSSIKYTIINGSAIQTEDFIKEENSGGIIGFAPGETFKKISFQTFQDSIEENDENFAIYISASSTPSNSRSIFPSGRLFYCTITELKIKDFDPATGGVTTNIGIDTPFGGTVPVLTVPRITNVKPVGTGTQSPASSLPTRKSVSVEADQRFYVEGSTAVFTITTNNIEDGTEYTYTLSGDIDSQDIIGGQLTGLFTIINGTAEVRIGIAENNDDIFTEQVEVPRLDSNGDYVRKRYTITSASYDGEEIIFSTQGTHELEVGDIAQVTNLETTFYDNVYEVSAVTSTTFTVVPLETGTPGNVTGNAQSIVDAGLIFDIEERVNDSADSSESLVFTVDGTEASDTVTILGDEESGEQYYSVKSDKFFYNEGETITYTIKTINVPDNTVVSYRLFGDLIERTDIVEYEFTGEFTVVDNEAEVQIVIAKDQNFTEPAKELSFILEVVGEPTAIVVINPDSIVDTGDGGDGDGVLNQTYFVSSDKLEYKEGETVEFTVTTTNVPDGTSLQYVLLGVGITGNDVVDGNTYGTFVVYNNTAKVYVGIKDDGEIETNETLIFVINGTGASASVVVLGEFEPEDPRDPDPLPVCVDAPIIGNPITDSKGSIISIPIIDRGCPYRVEPKIIVKGNGYGASAIALLDDLGYVSEIRVTRQGIGYKENTSENSNLVCVVDSYTLINVGRGYTSEPDVYINGELGIAEARIDQRGYVISVQVMDRTKTFNSLPKVQIVGGGGFGAKVIPSLACLDSKDLEAKGYVKIGTGKYIDCP